MYLYRSKRVTVTLDSSDATTGEERPPTRRERREAKRNRRGRHRPPFTFGNLVHFLIAVFLLWPIFLFIAVIASIGDAVDFVRYTAEALISSTLWFGRLLKEWAAGIFLHKNDPAAMRLRGARRAFGHEAAKDWNAAGAALLGIGRSWSKVFGLGGLFQSLEQRVQQANQHWRRYVVPAVDADTSNPPEFPEQFVVVDQLASGGSSARLYVVRRRGEEPHGPLYVLKYFDLRSGGNLESVIRESQAAQLAKRLGLIIESNLGVNAFWYVMPFYHGDTLTKSVFATVKKTRDQGYTALHEHNRVSLGYVHQILQIIAQYHEAGVFHKDIKPDNLIVNGERIYLIDIGLMTPLSSMHQLTTHGTEYFRDPEMVKLALEGREVREVNAAKFDIYSIGAVLFFAISGEFPTSGALSRLPDDVPMAVQWVVNRAMTGMDQRYDSARAMLTDVDYLCWAASSGSLDGVKPADLPSFRGMPVPPHLIQPAQVAHASTSYRAKLQAAPGGYGAWYSAPAYNKRPSFGVVKAIFTFMIVALVGALLLGAIGIVTEHRRQRRAINTVRVDELAGRVAADHRELRPVFRVIDRDLRDGVEVRRIHFADRTPRIELESRLLRESSALIDSWRHDLRSALVHSGGRDLLRGQSVFFLNIDPDEADRKEAAGIERGFWEEAQRSKMTTVADPHGERAEEARQAVLSIRDRMALHRELGTRYAEEGRVPDYLLVFTIEHKPGGKELHIRAIFPGREALTVIPFGEPRGIDPASPDREAKVTPANPK